jgi:hypothetical protein
VFWPAGREDCRLPQAIEDKQEEGAAVEAPAA